MKLVDLKPLDEGVPLHDVVRTNVPFDDIPSAPFWVWVGFFAIDVVLWCLIIFGGLWFAGLISEML